MMGQTILLPKNVMGTVDPAISMQRNALLAIMNSSSMEISINVKPVQLNVQFAHQEWYVLYVDQSTN